MKGDAIVVTNCTNRKRVGRVDVAFRQVGTSGSLASIAARWAKAIGKAQRTTQAADVYAGRAFVEARRVTEILDGTLHIVSAGLGIVGASDLIPAYDLTVADGENSLKPLLARLGQEPGDWWAALTGELGEHRSIRALLAKHPTALVLFALPGSYVALIAPDLSCLTKSQVNRIRIITSGHGQTLVPDHARHVVLPYDERLEGSSYAGTRTDFAQRALRHFVEVLHGHRLSVEDGREAVADAMRTLRKPVIPSRAKKTDAEILVLLRKNWSRFGGASTRLLRYLRDDALVSCEQGRFRGLWSLLQQEFATNGKS